MSLYYIALVIIERKNVADIQLGDVILWSDDTLNIVIEITRQRWQNKITFLASKSGIGSTTTSLTAFFKVMA